MGVVVRLFIDTQEQISGPPLCLIEVHEETDIRPYSVIYRPVGSTKELVTKLSPHNFSVIVGTQFCDQLLCGDTS
jgi:hypothetical protein